MVDFDKQIKTISLHDVPREHYPIGRGKEKQTSANISLGIDNSSTGGRIKKKNYQIKVSPTSNLRGEICAFDFRTIAKRKWGERTRNNVKKKLL